MLLSSAIISIDSVQYYMCFVLRLRLHDYRWISYGDSLAVRYDTGIYTFVYDYRLIS